MGKNRNKGYSLKEREKDTCRAKVSDAEVHFKNTTETARAIRGMTVKRATEYLKNVVARKECVPFLKYNGGVGRCAQAKQFGATQGRWPRKSANFVMSALNNAVANGEVAGLDSELLYVKHVQTNPGVVRKRRTYRAHGRITPYNRHLCHLQIVLALTED